MNLKAKKSSMRIFLLLFLLFMVSTYKKYLPKNFFPSATNVWKNSLTHIKGKLPSVPNFGKLPKRLKSKFTPSKLLGKFPPFTQKFQLSAKQEIFGKINN
jgi:hypothetical protein